MRIAIDSNVLAYAEGVNDAEHGEQARDLIQALPDELVILPVQVLGELYSVLRRKRRTPPAEAREIVLSWSNVFKTVETTPSVMTSALFLAAEHGLQVWDAVILAAASEAGCRVLLSEDMHDGFTWGGVTVVNPFAAQPHPLLLGLTRPER